MSSYQTADLPESIESAEDADRKANLCKLLGAVTGMPTTASAVESRTLNSNREAGPLERQQGPSRFREQREAAGEREELPAPGTQHSEAAQSVAETSVFVLL